MINIKNQSDNLLQRGFVLSISDIDDHFIERTFFIKIGEIFKLIPISKLLLIFISFEKKV